MRFQMYTIHDVSTFIEPARGQILEHFQLKPGKSYSSPPVIVRTLSRYGEFQRTVVVSIDTLVWEPARPVLPTFGEKYPS